MLVQLSNPNINTMLFQRWKTTIFQCCYNIVVPAGKTQLKLFYEAMSKESQNQFDSHKNIVFDIS